MDYRWILDGLLMHYWQWIIGKMHETVKNTLVPMRPGTRARWGGLRPPLPPTPPEFVGVLKASHTPLHWGAKAPQTPPALTAQQLEEPRKSYYLK